MNTLAITASTSGAGAPAFTASLRRIVQKNGILFSTIKPFSPLPRGLRFSHHVVNESTTTELSPDPISERSEADKIVDGMDFGQLCNEFECISSPLVESTARQLVRDILELRQRDRSLGIYAVFVKYKDPIRSFTGREKYERPLWEADALENSSVAVQEMLMLSTSVLNIKWTIRGKPRSLLASIGGDLIVKVNSRFTLNQISGQVIEHEESWDLSACSPVGRAYFWASRTLLLCSRLGRMWLTLPRT